jgi:hypothetical protein
VVSSVKSIARQQFEANKIGWTKSLLEGISQDDDGNFVPWMSYPAIEFLKNHINKNHEIFEFGCGASTLFFSKRAKKVVGLETNEKWLGIIQEKLNQLVEPVETEKMTQNGHFRPAGTIPWFRQAQPAGNTLINLMPDGLTNPNYENFPKDCGQKFDFIIVDSLKRFECAKNAIAALKPEGAIILDDSERKNYKKIFDFFAENNFRQQDFIGIAPGQLRLKNTTIFSKNANSG